MYLGLHKIQFTRKPESVKVYFCFIFGLPPSFALRREAADFFAVIVCPALRARTQAK